METKKRNKQRDFTITDKRVFLLKFDDPRFFTDHLPMEFSQLDLLQIMAHLKPRNIRLYEKFAKIIKETDKRTGEKTDLSRVLPKRRYNGELH